MINKSIVKNQKLLIMINKSIVICLLFFGLLSVLSSCEKEEEPDDHHKSTITGHVKHHEQHIPLATVYIRYGVTEFPGADPSAYDDSMIASSTDGHYHFENLSKGSYYLYATGFDSSVVDSVFGGVPVEITKHDETLEVNVPVTE